MEPSEKTLPEASLWLAAARWAVKKFKWFFNRVVVYLPEAELVDLFRMRDVHPKVKVFLLDLQLYNVTFEVGKGAWAYS